MGGGTYSVSSHYVRSANLGYATKSTSEVFSQKSINNAMSPYGISIRESRDSKEHPESLAIILALDVTGSMGSIPHYLVKDGLPNIMESIIQKGIKDPQILFLAIGDHECDSAPLQVGQFESSDDLLDKWLTTVYLEGGGGGNDGESYLLAWYFALKHTSIDCFEKRKQKGFIFTIGDEPTLKNIPKGTLKEIMGEGQYDNNIDAFYLIEKLNEKYNIYHLHIKQTSSGSRQIVMNGWKQLLKDNLIIVENKEDVSNIIADIIIKNTNIQSGNSFKEESDKDEENEAIFIK